MNLLMIILNKKIICIFLLSLFLAFSAIPALAQQNLQNAFEKDGPRGKAADDAGYKIVDDAVGTTEELVGKIVRVVLSFLGVIFLVLIIYGGYMWMLARGNEQQVEKAKNVIIAAIIGMIIVLAAYAISGFIIDQFGEATLQSE